MREFSGSVRSIRINLMVWGYLLLLALTLLTLWPAGGVLSVVSERGRQIFSLFFNANLTLLILLVPAFSATSITYERENETFNALFTTLLTPFEIVSGKLLACLTMLLACVLLSLPIAAVSALTGGVSMQFLAAVATILFVTAVTYGLVGLACSAVCVTSYSAILLNYALILLLAGGTWLPGALFGNLLGVKWLWQILRSASPYDALLYLLYPEEYRMTMGTLTTMVSPFLVFLAASALVSFISLLNLLPQAHAPRRARLRRKGRGLHRHQEGDQAQTELAVLPDRSIEAQEADRKILKPGVRGRDAQQALREPEIRGQDSLRHLHNQHVHPDPHRPPVRILAQG